jgi:hypothetical protein
MSGSGDRGQAFTLEGVVAAMMVLIALLFALEAVLVTPITTGAVDEGTQSRLGAEANDVLRITADRAEEDLAYWARYWSPVNRTFAGAESPADVHVSESGVVARDRRHVRRDRRLLGRGDRPR